jgi:hypothetical protein
MANIIVYKKTALTGGTSNSLDGIDGNALFGGELALVHTVAKELYVYQLNPTSAQAASSPSIIAPGANPGNKRWEQLTLKSLL